MKIAFTVCNRHQLRHALTLGESLLRHNPDFRFMVGWIDPAPLPELPQWVDVIPVDELDIADWSAMKGHYYDFEVIAGCKPFFARYILQKNPACKTLVYLAPTVWVLSSFGTILDSKAFFQPTPHRLSPITTPGRLDDKAILNIGMYHAGSWVLQPDGQERKLLDWWCERTTDRAFFDLCHGMCLDQLWMNYLPALLESVQPIRNSGWHYGLHAVPDHKLSQDNQNTYQINGQPLLTVDFTGIEGYHPVWTNHSGLIEGKKHWPALLASYRKALGIHKVPAFDVVSAPYGKLPVIKTYRRGRKKAVDLLKKMIHRIETYDLTHN